jgi:ATP-dependent helicase HrpB
MDHLPIHDILPRLKKILNDHNTVILQAPPGAGKSTALPPVLLKEKWLNGKKIIMLEPRRLAARSVASRIAFLLDENVGETAGYRIRFENKISASTRIEVVTEGILTRILQNDNTLEDVGLVIFDEFHERSLHADLALALCREIQSVLRDDLKILVMSATLDEEKLSSVLGNAPIVSSEGRQYPVDIKYSPSEPNLSISAQVSRAVLKAIRSEDGDILVFLPGAGDIHRCAELIEAEASGIFIYPLYGDLSQQKQQEAIMPDQYGRRKIVLSTSIAETSLTIEGIKVVIDSGYSRVPRFDPNTGLTRLETIRVTKDAADQRAGRAGRLGPGTCYRLWVEGSHQHLVPHRRPEILEADLAPMMLELAQWGVNDLKILSWLTPPPAGAVSQARELLTQLDAVSENRITSKGKKMLTLPAHPRIAHMLLEGAEEGNIALAIDAASLLDERDPLPREAGANLALRVEALRKWRRKDYVNAEKNVLERVERAAASWRKNFNISPDNSHFGEQQLGKLLAAAYPERIAKKIKHSRYRLANGRIAKIHEHDPLAAETWIIAAHLDGGSNESRIYMAASLDPDDLLHLSSQQDNISWDSGKGILSARWERRIGNIVVESTQIENIPEEQKIKILCDAIRSEGINILPWTDELIEWKKRISNVKIWRTDEDWPDLSDEQLLDTLEEWLSPFISGVRKREDFKKLELHNILSGLLSWEQSQRLEKLAPAKIKVPTGSLITLKYNADGSPPILAVRLQEVFGLLETPAVNEGRTKVMLHLLSPGYRPVQVTQDLKSFWNTTYAEVRKDLRARYSKHHWPEDPWTAEAVRGVKRKFR